MYNLPKVYAISKQMTLEDSLNTTIRHGYFSKKKKKIELVFWYYEQ